MQLVQSKTKKSVKKVVLKGKKVQPPKKSKNIPTTVEHLEAVESKLSSQITTVFLKTVTNNEDIRHLNKRMDSLKSEISSKFAKVDMRFDRTDKRMDALEQRMDALEQRMDKLEQRMERLEFEMKEGFREIKQLIQSLAPSIHYQKAL